MSVINMIIATKDIVANSYDYNHGYVMAHMMGTFGFHSHVIMPIHIC
jgi:hypothetical protein